MDTFDRVLLVLMIFGSSLLVFTSIDQVIDKRMSVIEAKLDVKLTQKD